LENQLGIGDLKAVKRTSTGYVLENGMEIEDTFAEMFTVMEISPAQSPFLVFTAWCGVQRVPGVRNQPNMTQNE